MDTPKGYTINRATVDSGRHDALFRESDSLYLGDITAQRGTDEYAEQIAELIAASESDPE